MKRFVLDIEAIKIAEQTGIPGRTILLGLRVYGLSQRCGPIISGASKSPFYLHLKECEFRFNHRHDDLFFPDFPNRSLNVSID